MTTKIVHPVQKVVRKRSSATRLLSGPPELSAGAPSSLELLGHESKVKEEAKMLRNKEVGLRASGGCGAEIRITRGWNTCGIAGPRVTSTVCLNDWGCHHLIAKTTSERLHSLTDDPDSPR